MKTQRRDSGHAIVPRLLAPAVLASIIIASDALSPSASPTAAALQAGRGGLPEASPTPRAEAPIDLTGWWVSVVTEDWRWRMVTPPKGDYASVPMNNEGRRLADSWDPAKDEREGNACRAYGAAAIMRVPGRLHISWADDRTLVVETDAGMQMRALHFGDAPAASEPTWQGRSVASWDILGGVRSAAGGGAGGGANAAPAGRAAATGPPPPRYGGLKVVTTNMKAGYLRKNGVPYSDAAVLTEYVDRHTEKNGDTWLTVTSIVDDPKYLTGSFVTSSHFKKEPDNSKWRPVPCTTQ
jgi:hypothetical protein